MKRIVVPVDFSLFSERAIETATSIAEKARAFVSLVHVVPTELKWDGLTNEEKQKHPKLSAQAQTADEKLASLINNYASDNESFEQVVLYGYPYEQIIQFASEQNADLIVMGAYGKEMKDKPYIGSTVQKVLRMAHVPVLTVKEPFGYKQFSKIVFASDFDVQAKSAFQQVKHIAKLFEATLYLLYINTPAKFISTPEAKNRMNSFLTGKENIPIHTHLYDYPTVEDGLNSFTHSLGDCCLALATHERKLASLYQAGVTETMVYRLPVPVISTKIHC